MNSMRWVVAMLAVSWCGSCLSGQTLQDYMAEMSGSGIDAPFNAIIDSVWTAVIEVEGEAPDVEAYVSRLIAYADSSTNEITRDKAELYAYFIMLRRKDYSQIMDRYRDNINRYGLRGTVMIFPVYRTAYLKTTENGIGSFSEDLGLRIREISDEAVAEFYIGKLELQPGESAPNAVYRDLNGMVYTSEDLLGKVVVLDFWATWCLPCIKELPELQRLYAEYGERPDFLLLSVSLDKDQAKLEQFLAARDLEWTQVRDDSEKGGAGNNHEGTLATTFRATGLPKYILIDKEGILRYNSYLNDKKMIPSNMIDMYLAN